MNLAAEITRCFQPEAPIAILLGVNPLNSNLAATISIPSYRLIEYTPRVAECLEKITFTEKTASTIVPPLIAWSATYIVFSSFDLKALKDSFSLHLCRIPRHPVDLFYPLYGSTI